VSAYLGTGGHGESRKHVTVGMVIGMWVAEEAALGVLDEVRGEAAKGVRGGTAGISGYSLDQDRQVHCLGCEGPGGGVAVMAVRELCALLLWFGSEERGVAFDWVLQGVLLARHVQCALAYDGVEDGIGEEGYVLYLFPAVYGKYGMVMLSTVDLRGRPSAAGTLRHAGTVVLPPPRSCSALFIWAAIMVA
jgi:hypothetical protein